MTRMRFRVENHLLASNRPPLPDEMPHTVRLLPQAATQDEIIPWLIINHTQAASRAISLEAAWLTDTKRTDGIESHLLCDMQGRLLQSMPFNIVAHTSYRANRFFVSGVGYCGQLSVESQDQGSATLNQTPWSPPQFEVLCQAWAAACVHYGIPVQPVPNAYGRGVSQHNAFAEWSKSAHSCPGVARTQQMPAMRARIQQIIEDDRNPDDLEDEMASTIQITDDGSNVTDAFVGTLDGMFVTWQNNGDAAQALRDGQVIAGAKLVRRVGLKGLTLIGPAPDDPGFESAYNGATLPGRTKGSDFGARIR